MAEAASFGQVASPERADLPLHLAWARFLALRHRKDARPRLGSVCPNHGRFISTREKSEEVPSHVGDELRQRERERGRYHWGNVDNLGRVASVTQ